VRREFNEQFWYETGGYLYDVIDTPSNQIAVDAQGRDVRIPRMSVGDSASCRSRVPPHVGRLKGAGRGTFCSVAFFN
jgi:hypothetical protein